ncbi:MAG: hypothetical protein HYR64_10900 [Fimbriimonas ginsengisoli]|uniref:O-GlcNAc transferase C-terminal domain-containing protein n=1 Tax=Fimbriimonas ginsengisoli TaxID=1005039 RepID=A0A931LWN0_FIMGI|nr:hypothetical protein [Fimbriimonas ginsengisoli]
MLPPEATDWPPAKPAYRPLLSDPGGEAPPKDRMLALFDRLSQLDGRYDDAIECLSEGATVAHRLQRIWTPFSYSKDEDIDRWRAHFLAALADFETTGYDPHEAYDALAQMHTFNVAYQGRDVLPLLKPFGQLVHRVAAHVAPDLVEPIEPKGRHGKIRVGYISHNLFGNHASRWARGWARSHADDFEVYAFNIGNTTDEVTADWQNIADYYYSMPRRPAAGARFIRDLELDALVFTDLGMNGRSYQYAGFRLAPVQCTAWGHPVSSGLPTIDYYLSSDLMEPPGAEGHYSECLVRLPESGLCYPRPTGTPSELGRSELGLTNKGPLVVLCQNTMKFLPQWDFLYAGIAERLRVPLVAVESIVRSANEELRTRMQRLGVKVVWIPRIRHNGHYLRLLQLADVSLDPPGWSGGNTTIETLLMGTPVVTLPGEFMRGNHSMAFHQIAGVPGLIAKDPEDYVDLACDFERQLEAMKGLNLDALFDDLRPVRALDDFLRQATRA